MAEVASVGGFVKQYQVVVDPEKLRAYGIPLSKVTDAIRASNMDVGGRTVELAETEFAVRGRGYIKSLSDLEQIVVKNDRGVPVFPLRPRLHFSAQLVRHEVQTIANAQNRVSQ